tara:strand:- start:2084 stop:3382 length:1299 start_codon:yes stop_codon:yes gene_type:complete
VNKIKILFLHKWNQERLIDKFILNSNNNDYQKIEQNIFDNSFYQGGITLSKKINLNYFVDNVIVDAKDLNQNWLKNFSSKNFENLNYEDIAIERIKIINPDIIYFQDPRILSYDSLKNIKEKVGNLKYLVSSCGFPVDDKYYPLFDKIIIRSPLLFKKLIKRDFNNIYFHYHCFDETVLNKILIKPFKSREIISSFIGNSFGKNHNNHKKRYLYLDEICKKKIAEVFLNEDLKFTYRNKNYLYKILNLLALLPAFFKNLIIIFLKIITNFTFNSENKIIRKNNIIKLKKYLFHKTDFTTENFLFKGSLKSRYSDIKNELYGLDMLNAINDTKLSINIHTDYEINSVANMRMFEITGMGSCLFVENGENIRELFNEDEVITYNSYEELEDKIIFFKKNLEKAEKIAFNGNQKTLKYFTFENYSKFLINNIFKF